MKKLIYFFVVLISLTTVLASEVAYVVKLNADAEQGVKSALNEMGLRYDVILESQIASTNFSDYAIIIVGDSNFNNATEIPFNEHRSLILNHYHYYKEFGWSSDQGSTSSNPYTKIKNDAPTHQILQGIGSEWIAYNTGGKPVYYLKGAKASGIDSDDLLAHVLGSNHQRSDSVLTVALPGVIYRSYRGKIKVEQSKSVFYGLTETNYWTPDSKKVFKNIINWLLEDIDQDGDGVVYEEDCDDNDETIYPGANEIPYDGIDQNCDNSDLTDVDEDGFDAEIVDGEDCDDNDETIYPGAQEVIDDTNQNCENDEPILLQEINDLEWDEDDVFNLEEISDYFSDPEGDELEFNLGGIDNVSVELEGNNLIFISDPDWFGEVNVVLIADDGELEASSNEFRIKVIDTFDPDVTPPIISLKVPEDEFFSLRDSVEFIFSAEDDVSDVLNCGFYSNIEDNTFKINGEEFTYNVGENKRLISSDIPDGTYLWNVKCKDESDNEAFALENRVFTIDEPDRPEIININEFKIEINEDFVSYDFDLTRFESDDEDLGEELKWEIVNKAGNFDAEIGNLNEDILILTSQENEFCLNNCGILLRLSDSDGLFSEQYLEIKIMAVNDEPISGTIDEQEINEDEVLRLNLNEFFSDVDNDILEFSYLNGEHLNVEFDNGVAEITPEENWNGQTNIKFIGSDNEASVESNEVTVFVAPVNDAPVLNEIETITVNEGEIVEIIPLASDVDGDVLFYSIDDNRFSKVDDKFLWETGFDDEGDYFFKITVTDGFLFDEGNFNVDVLSFNIPPVLDEFEDIEILEDSGRQEVLTLIASDVDGVINRFEVVNERRVDCSIEDNRLFVEPSENFFGQDRCIIKVFDNEGGSDEGEVNIIVENVQDKPVITNKFPNANLVEVKTNSLQNFFVNVIEVDNDVLNYEWKLDGNIVSQERTYTFFSGTNEMEHNLTIKVSDNIDFDNGSWTIVVKNGVITENKNCQELNGFICNPEINFCSGQILNAIDTNYCCNIQCTPLITDGNDTGNLSKLNKCVNGTKGNIKVDIDEPGNNDEFLPRDKIDIEVNVENDEKEDLDIIVEAILFNIDDNEKIEKIKTDDFEVGDDDEEDIELELEIPDGEINEDDDYILFVIAFEQCNE